MWNGKMQADEGVERDDRSYLSQHDHDHHVIGECNQFLVGCCFFHENVHLGDDLVG